MSLKKKIANWLDPDRDWQVGHLNTQLGVKDADIDMLYESRDTYRRSNENLVTKLADAAANISLLRAQVKKLRYALFDARTYVMGAYDDATADLDALPVKSKKRPALAAVQAAIAADLANIAAALASSSTPQPGTPTKPDEEPQPGTPENANADAEVKP